MPIAAIIALVSGVIAGVPKAVSAFEALKQMLTSGKSTVTKEELEELLSEATAAHEELQGS